jgi:hypothetical protein
MHNEHVCYVSDEEARDILKQKFGRTFGSKKKVLGIRLTVPLSKLTGNEASQKALTIANSTGTRFIFKQKVRTRTRGTQSIFRFKKLNEAEAPEYSLLRILTPPALEAPTHQLWYECSLVERNSNAAARKRKDVAEIFRISNSSRSKLVSSAGKKAGTCEELPAIRSGSVLSALIQTSWESRGLAASKPLTNPPSHSAAGVTGKARRVITSYDPRHDSSSDTVLISPV